MIQKATATLYQFIIGLFSDENLISPYNWAVARFFNPGGGGGGGVIMSAECTSLVGGGGEDLGVSSSIKIFKFGGSEVPYSIPGFWCSL